MPYLLQPITLLLSAETHSLFNLTEHGNLHRWNHRFTGTEFNDWLLDEVLNSGRGLKTLINAQIARTQYDPDKGLYY